MHRLPLPPPSVTSPLGTTHPLRQPRPTRCTRIAPWSDRVLLSVAGHLAGSIDWPAGLGAGAEREWELAFETPDLQAWVIGWPPGGAVEFHDHGGSVGAVAVIEGSLRETSVRREHHRLVTRSRTLRPTSPPLFVGAGDVHDVTNPGPDRALSVHVYSPRLASMTYFRMERGELRPRETARFAPHGPGEVFSELRVS